MAGKKSEPRDLANEDRTKWLHDEPLLHQWWKSTNMTMPSFFNKYAAEFDATVEGFKRERKKEK